MDETKKQVILDEIEEKELYEGQSLYETTKTAGFEILKRKLDDLAYHSWVDPRSVTNKEDWEWQELNSFHAANNARELLEWIQKMISRSEYLDKKKKGEIQVKPMKI